MESTRLTWDVPPGVEVRSVRLLGPNLIKAYPTASRMRDEVWLISPFVDSTTAQAIAGWGGKRSEPYSRSRARSMSWHRPLTGPKFGTDWTKSSAMMRQSFRQRDSTLWTMDPGKKRTDRRRGAAALRPSREVALLRQGQAAETGGSANATDRAWGGEGKLRGRGRDRDPPRSCRRVSPFSAVRPPLRRAQNPRAKGDQVAEEKLESFVTGFAATG